MGRSAIASADVVRIPLGEGEFLTVKAELNAGETLDLADESGNRTIAAVIAYLVGWSLVGPGDQPIPYNPTQTIAERRDTLRALKAATFEAITDALLPHIRAGRAAIDEKKSIPEPALAS